MTALDPVFFAGQVRSILAAGDLDTAASLIMEASEAKERGFGPPLDDLNRARRAWLNAYERIAAPAIIDHERII